MTTSIPLPLPPPPPHPPYITTRKTAQKFKQADLMLPPWCQTAEGDNVNYCGEEMPCSASQKQKKPWWLVTKSLHTSTSHPLEIQSWIPVECLVFTGYVTLVWSSSFRKCRHVTFYTSSLLMLALCHVVQCSEHLELVIMQQKDISTVTTYGSEKINGSYAAGFASATREASVFLLYRYVSVSGSPLLWKARPLVSIV